MGKSTLLVPGTEEGKARIAWWRKRFAEARRQTEANGLQKMGPQELANFVADARKDARKDRRLGKISKSVIMERVEADHGSRPK